MENKNICKFNISRTSDLICTNFIFETHCGQQHDMEAGSHIIGLIMEGESTLFLGEHPHTLQAGDLFFIPRYTKFRIEQADLLHYFYISFQGRRGDELLMRMHIQHDNCVFHGHSALIPFWHECLSSADSHNIDLISESVLLYSLAHLQPAKAASDDVLSKMIALTQEHFTEPTLSLSRIADELGYDSKYLSTVFKRKKGMVYTQYLRDMRIRHSIFLMEEGLVSVKNIAILSGFHDPLYFSKVFTESEGISPKNYISDLNSKTPAP